MKTNLFSSSRSKIIGLTCIVGLLLVGFTQAFGQISVAQLQNQPLNLDVPVLKQAWGTSCGEAVIAMTYNFAHPESPITEGEVIEYAAGNEYYTADISPYTSPASMVKIARYYTRNISTGRVFSSSQGLGLLYRQLRDGDPIIIDVLSNFRDPESEAHFIVVTGISSDPNQEDAIIIHYNDPLTGTRESGDWAGSEGVWNAWHANKDPGGPGWWLVISAD